MTESPGIPAQCPCYGKTVFDFAFAGNIGRKVEARFSQYAFYDDLYRCRSCGLLAQKQIDRATIVELLKAERYLDETIGKLNLAEKHCQFDILIDLIGRHASLAEARLLDVGANTGVFLKSVGAYTSRARGLEPSREAAQSGRETLGVDIENAVIGEANLPPASFDIITMFDVVEHLCAPESDLAVLRDALAPGGRLFITTHDIDTTYARLLGRHYPMLMYQHFFHFSPKTLGMLLERIGMRVVATHYFPKSWSVAYLAELPEKKWPGSLTSKLLSAMLAPLTASERLKRLRITWPLREFFLCVAERVE